MVFIIYSTIKFCSPNQHQRKLKVIGKIGSDFSTIGYTIGYEQLGSVFEIDRQKGNNILRHSIFVYYWTNIMIYFFEVVENRNIPVISLHETPLVFKEKKELESEAMSIDEKKESERCKLVKTLRAYDELYGPDEDSLVRGALTIALEQLNCKN